MTFNLWPGLAGSSPEWWLTFLKSLFSLLSCGIPQLKRVFERALPQKPRRKGECEIETNNRLGILLQTPEQPVDCLVSTFRRFKSMHLPVGHVRNPDLS
jgi:hypothetical protein